jgi:uncharacterized membrane protein YeaQ/YmgE (transglycosylase-associated protein family)
LNPQIVWFIVSVDQGIINHHLIAVGGAVLLLVIYRAVKPS